MAKYSPGQNRLTNNFSANMKIFILAAALLTGLSLTGVLHLSFDLMPWGGGGARGGTWGQSLWSHLGVFFIVYFFTSYWFNPDLDLRENRPGKGSFPFKWILKKIHKTRKNWPFLSFLLTPLEVLVTPLHTVLNVCWRNFWHPFGHAFTHRGIVHCPVVGTQLKILYIFFPYWLVSYLAGMVGRLPFIEGGLGASLFARGGLYHELTHEPLLITAFAATLIADTLHIAVDYYDSVRNGTRFLPPPMIAPRGFVWRFYRFVSSRLWG